MATYSIQESIFAAVKENPTLASMLVYDSTFYHIYPLRIPPDQIDTLTTTKLYYLVYHIASNPKNPWLDLEYQQIQFDCLCNTYENHLLLKENMISLLDRFGPGYLSAAAPRAVKKIWLENEVEADNDDTNLYMTSLFFRFKYFGDQANP